MHSHAPPPRLPATPASLVLSAGGWALPRQPCISRYSTLPMFPQPTAVSGLSRSKSRPGSQLRKGRTEPGASPLPGKSCPSRQPSSQWDSLAGTHPPFPRAGGDPGPSPTLWGGGPGTPVLTVGHKTPYVAQPCPPASALQAEPASAWSAPSGAMGLGVHSRCCRRQGSSCHHHLRAVMSLLPVS